MKLPRTVSALWKVLGVFSFYRRFVRNAADIMAPLYDLLKGRMGKRDRTLIRWTSTLEKSFAGVKTAFENFTLLHFMDDESPLQLTCDALGMAVGGVLEQVVNGKPRPIAFYSEKLKGNQLTWIPYDKELYAIYTCVVNLEYLIQGFDVTIVTDHKALLSMFQTRKRIALERRSRQFEYVSQSTTKIRHIAGGYNVIADAISHPELPQYRGMCSRLETLRRPSSETMRSRD